MNCKCTLCSCRELKSARGSASRRRQGNAGFKQMAAQGEVKQGNKKPVNSKNATDNNRRGSGRGGRGRGKGLKRNSPASESQPTSSRSSPKYSPKPPARAPKPLPVSGRLVVLQCRDFFTGYLLAHPYLLDQTLLSFSSRL